MRRILAAVLLVLAASPLTAPFSIGDPLDLFGGAAQIQSKKAPDAPAADLDAPLSGAARLEIVVVAGPVLAACDHSVSLPLTRPLRV